MNTPAREERIGGLDWLRAAMSVAVVAWHFAGGGRSSLFEEGLPEHHVGLSDLVNFHLLLLAVPTFMIISSYLLARARPDARMLARRAGRLGVLLLFWSVALKLFQGGWQGLWSSLPVFLSDWPLYVLSGGGTIFYFFVSLLLVQALTVVASRLPLATVAALLLASLVATGLLPLASIRLHWPLLCAFWSPVNFLPYAFAAVVVLRGFDRDEPARASAAIAVLLVLAAGLAVLEWRAYRNTVFFPGQFVNFPIYCRPSVALSAMALLILAVRSPAPAPRAVRFMARHALALYCLHMFTSDPVRLVVQWLAGGLPELGQDWALIVLTVLASYLAALALARVWKEKLLY